MKIYQIIKYHTYFGIGERTECETICFVSEDKLNFAIDLVVEKYWNEFTPSQTHAIYETIYQEPTREQFDDSLMFAFAQREFNIFKHWNKMVINMQPITEEERKKMLKDTILNKNDKNIYSGIEIKEIKMWNGIDEIN